MPSTFKAIDALPSTATSSASSVAAEALASLTTTYRYNNTILLPSLEERLQTPPSAATAQSSTFSISPAATAGLSEINSSTGLTSISHVASVVVSNFLPLSTTSLSSSNNDDSTSADDTQILSSASSTTTLSSSPATAAAATTSATSSAATTTTSSFYPSYSPPAVESLVASSAEEFSNNFRDLSFDIFDDNDNDLFGSPLAFDASENGLWNGRFVPPPPRPPFFVDEPVLSDGLTTCDLCSWAMPTKSTFIFEGTMEKASELGWPLTLTIVSILSAILGAIIMIAVVKCRRKKTSHQRSDTHVQWWSRNKRPNGNNNHLRRSNIYTAHPADSIRGLQQPNSLSASSSMTAMTTAMTVAPTNTPTSHNAQQQQQQLPYYLTPQQHSNTLPAHLLLGGSSQQQQYLQQFEHEHEYHQPQELQLQLQPQQQQPAFNHQHHQQQQHHHNTLHHHHHLHTQQQQHPAVIVGNILQTGSLAPQHQHSASSMSSSSTNSMPSLSAQPLHKQQMQMPEQIHLQSSNQPQHVHLQHKQQKHMQQKQKHQQQPHHKPHHHHHKQQQKQHQQRQLHEPNLELEQSVPTSSLSSSSTTTSSSSSGAQTAAAAVSASTDLHDQMFHWPTATSIVTS
ncbi:uncharacterized protein ACRADG_002164 isoform 1-T2 [Cochliomyia hominivorax]